uniref:Uncharacterized protein n=1 Tax=Chelonoidis abingdonii TaxID=106734 RepID=A0A8C0GD78_CHEAB
MGHHAGQLLPGSLAGRGELLRKVGGQDNDEDGSAQSPTHPEVLGIHMQLVAVQLAQLGVRGLDVVQVLHSVPKGGQHLLAVGTHLGVAHNGGGAGEVPEVREKPLGPGVDDQQPRERETGAETDTGFLQPPCKSSRFSLPTCGIHGFVTEVPEPEMTQSFPLSPPW